VNLASRLEGLSKEFGVSIVLGPDTAAAVRHDFVLLELDRIAVRGRATQSAIFTVVAPAARRDDPSIVELEATHPRVLESLRAGRTAEAAALIERCRTLVPALVPYYAKLEGRFAAAKAEPSH
jgi:adenylate cyclase